MLYALADFVSPSSSFFCVLQGLIAAQVVVLYFLNKGKERERVANGKPAKMHDLSMAHNYDNSEVLQDKHLNQHDGEDLTDRFQDEFVYLY